MNPGKLIMGASTRSTNGALKVRLIFVIDRSVGIIKSHCALTAKLAYISSD